MKICHHLDLATVLSLGAGSLDESLAVVAASHAAWCLDCAEALARAEEVGGAMLDRLEPTPLGSGAGAALLARLTEDGLSVRLSDGKPLARSGDLPAPLAAAVGRPLGQLKWRKLARGIELHEVKLSPEAKGRLRIWRLAPGKRTPEHGHGASEITLVLNGSLTDAAGRYARGDVADLGDDVEHGPVAGAEDECVCVIASETPARFKTLFARLLQPILGT